MFGSLLIVVLSATVGVAGPIDSTRQAAKVAPDSRPKRGAVERAAGELSPGEVVNMMPTQPYTYVSSRLVKEVVALGGSVHGLVPESVEKRLREKKLARETLRA